MIQKFRKMTLERQMFLSFSCASALLLITTLLAVLSFEFRQQEQRADALISNTAQYIASMDQVVKMLEQGYPDYQVKEQLDALHKYYTDLDTIAIYDSHSLRFYHTSRGETGETFVAGEEAPILDGAEPYLTTGYSTLGSQRRMFQAIHDRQGEVIGFVTVSIFHKGILQQNLSLVPVFIYILTAALIIAVLTTRGIIHLLRRSLNGYQPAELLDIYLRQDGVLNAVEEGLIATDDQGVVVFSNDPAHQLFGMDEGELVGQRLTDFFPETICIQAAWSGAEEHNRSLVIGGRQVLVTTLPIQGKSGRRGALNVFQDKTELRKLSDELSGTREMLDTLRFFNHEFMNKLHIILGYLQTNQVQTAIQFIVNSSLVSSSSIRETANCIRAPRLCALIIGKMMHAAELGIRLTVSRDSFCREEDLLISEKDCATILGNLLENAIEELSQGQHDVREIKLAMFCRPDYNLITCEDTGGGIAPDFLPHIWEKGASSKGEGRGCGLHLVQQLIQEHNGAIQVDTEPGEGTLFTLTFTQPRKDF